MKYWTIPDDGADFSCFCGDCPRERRYSHSEMVLIETPDGRRTAMARECVDEDWLSRATYQGDMTE